MRWKKKTYTKPRPRIAATVIFVRLFICTLQRIMAGIIAQEKSMIKVTAEKKYAVATVTSLLTHLPRLGSHAAATGRQILKATIKAIVLDKMFRTSKL